MNIFVLIALTISTIYASELLITKEYTDYLKRHVDWEVVDYEKNVFRGWTIEESQSLFGAIPLSAADAEEQIPSVVAQKNLPASLDWSGANCDHGIRNQGHCGSCWAVATSMMLTDKCCVQGHDHGFLSIQELVSCDKTSHGCTGGWCTWALNYVTKVGGLVHEACYPYKAIDAPCARTCADGSNWASSHVCNCVGGYKNCKTTEEIKTCLQSGPIAVAFGVCNSMFYYRDGIYKCDCSPYTGIHDVEAMGYSDTPACYIILKNSWGVEWGNKGYFNMGCDQCGMTSTYASGNVMCEKVEP